MPFQSEAQKAFMHAAHPDVAKEFQKKTGDKKLPKRVSTAKKKK